MAFNLTTLAGKTAVVPVAFMGQSANITYDPTLLTAANMSKAEAGTDADFSAFFCDLVKDWDVTKGSRKVPINEKSLQDIPLPFLRAVFMAINADASLGEAESNSNGG